MTAFAGSLSGLAWSTASLQLGQSDMVDVRRKSDVFWAIYLADGGTFVRQVS